MSLSVGIVGLPNVGKSTLFNALLKRQVALAANYPFATIEPNTGVVPVPDDRLEKLAEIVGTQVIKPATVEFVDIAGLVKGASEGAGLGNKFLSHIREVDLVAHVVRAFADGSIIREGSVDPKTDREIIETELMLADLSTVERQKEPRPNQPKEDLEKWQVIKVVKDGLNSEQTARQAITTKFSTVKDQQFAFKTALELGLLTAKPVLYVLNVDESAIADQSAIAVLISSLDLPPESVVAISAKIESELSSLSEEDQQLYLAELGLEKSGLERLIQSAYQLLGLQSFLTAGEKEVRAWTIKSGATAPEAAGVIHTDFIKHFIRANVASYEDFVKLDGWKGVKEAGKMRVEGRDYVMQEGDVVEFLIGS